MTKRPNPVDLHVGDRLRTRRKHVGISRKALGSALHVSVDRVRAYETGARRIEALRLQQIGMIVGVPPAFFFEGLPQVHPCDAARVVDDAMLGLAATPSSAQSLLLTQAFVRIRDPRIVSILITLVTTLAECGDTVCALSA